MQAQRKSREAEGSNLEGSKEGTPAKPKACLPLGTDSKAVVWGQKGVRM